MIYYFCFVQTPGRDVMIFFSIKRYCIPIESILYYNPIGIHHSTLFHKPDEFGNRVRVAVLFAMVVFCSIDICMYLPKLNSYGKGYNPSERPVISE